jgi:ribonuclease HI
MASHTGAVPTLSYHRPPMPRRPAIKETPVEQRPGEALIWTDGACSGNPVSGGEHATTNNRMELTAALEGLRSLEDGADVTVVTDSQLMLNSMTVWLPGWKKKGWKTAAGKPVKNQDLLVALEAEVNRLGSVRWHWVRGHETGAAHAHKAFNDRADQLAVAAAKAAA